jgi:hypothetical protein
MKRPLIILALIGVVLACSTAVFAASQKSWFMAYSIPALATVDHGIHANAQGWVTFNTVRAGGWDVTVQLLNAAKFCTYSVQAHGPGSTRATLTTDQKGNGRLQFHVTNPTALAECINIYVDSWGVDVHLCFAYNPFWISRNLSWPPGAC